MHGTQIQDSIAKCAPGMAPAMRRGERRYWSGLGLGWFVLALAIFYWGLHYRLQQYQSVRTHGSIVPVAKMWLGERSYTATPAGVHAERGPQFPVLIAFLGIVLILLSRVAFIAGHLSTANRIRPPRWWHHGVLFSRPPPVFTLL